MTLKDSGTVGIYLYLTEEEIEQLISAVKKHGHAPLLAEVNTAISRSKSGVVVTSPIKRGPPQGSCKALAVRIHNGEFAGECIEHVASRFRLRGASVRVQLHHLRKARG